MSVPDVTRFKERFRAASLHLCVIYCLLRLTPRPLTRCCYSTLQAEFRPGEPPVGRLVWGNPATVSPLTILLVQLFAVRPLNNGQKFSESQCRGVTAARRSNLSSTRWFTFGIEFEYWVDPVSRLLLENSPGSKHESGGRARSSVRYPHSMCIDVIRKRA